MENWREYLKEGMKTPNDISAAEEDWFKQNPDMLKEISVQIFSSGADIYFVYAHNNEPQWSVGMPLLKGLPSGYVAIVNAESRNFGPCLNGWSIKASEVEEGWGPLLYDLAMEWATKKGGGLMSDRNNVSKDAFAVWDYYDKRRSDIESIQLDITKGQAGQKQLTPKVPEDDCSQYSSIYWTDYEPGEWHEQPTSRIYRSKGTPTMEKMEALGKLDEK
tara:strand:+ start:29 stop:682 length:654 start_codon:yes stop_codon:yes gene_type:complete